MFRNTEHVFCSEKQKLFLSLELYISSSQEATKPRKHDKIHAVTTYTSQH